ncbi:hypothetical protein Bhyg_04631 [Pseudolycoriella hygida]|uniref:Uncharacterized protein n=1 Tax=Pseudolycoriella hygida TaxID=35572 RepID=A0A9Q0NFL8_9DIPT|nr:hypothetical protein Bhyg_04631 [Pseudolycoriella hygida]
MSDIKFKLNFMNSNEMDNHKEIDSRHLEMLKRYSVVNSVRDNELVNYFVSRQKSYHLVQEELQKYTLGRGILDNYFYNKEKNFGLLCVDDFFQVDSNKSLHTPSRRCIDTRETSPTENGADEKYEADEKDEPNEKDAANEKDEEAAQRPRPEYELRDKEAAQKLQPECELRDKEEATLETSLSQIILVDENYINDSASNNLVEPTAIEHQVYVEKVSESDDENEPSSESLSDGEDYRDDSGSTDPDETPAITRRRILYDEKYMFKEPIPTIDLTSSDDTPASVYVPAPATIEEMVHLGRFPKTTHVPVKDDDRDSSDSSDEEDLVFIPSNSTNFRKETTLTPSVNRLRNVSTQQRIRTYSSDDDCVLIEESVPVVDLISPEKTVVTVSVPVPSASTETAFQSTTPQEKSQICPFKITKRRQPVPIESPKRRVRALSTVSTATARRASMLDFPQFSQSFSKITKRRQPIPIPPSKRQKRTVTLIAENGAKDFLPILPNLHTESPSRYDGDPCRAGAGIGVH